MILQVTDAGKWAQVPCHKSCGPLNLNCACSLAPMCEWDERTAGVLFVSFYFYLFCLVRRKCEAQVGRKSKIVP